MSVTYFLCLGYAKNAMECAWYGLKKPISMFSLFATKLVPIDSF